MMTAGMRVVGYVRVSTAEQAESGAGMEAQRLAIREECDRRGWVLVEIHEDAGVSGKSMDQRAGLEAALRAVESRQVDGLVAAKIDRLSRSTADFTNMLQRAQKRGWSLIVLDMGLDMSSPSGEMMATILATFAQFERRIIGQRTKDALAVKKAQGVRLGRPRTLPRPVVERIVAERGAGRSMARIAEDLNWDQVPTARGGVRWYPSTVHSVMRSELLDA